MDHWFIFSLSFSTAPELLVPLICCGVEVASSRLCGRTGPSLKFTLESGQGVIISPFDFAGVVTLLEATLNEACPVFTDPRLCERFPVMVIPKDVGIADCTCLR